ncbi:MAG: type IV pili methyl-accepting chemotaxis transducer N-terminal domain-containing protein [Sedimenticola sp.]
MAVFNNVDYFKWLTVDLLGLLRCTSSADSNALSGKSSPLFSKPFTRLRSPLAFLLPALLLSSPLLAGVTDIQDAINVSGKQRMLTQKIMGSYAMLGMNFQPEKAKKRLQGSVALFDSQLADLKSFSVNDKVKSQLDAVDKLWGPLKTQMLAQPEKGKAVELSKKIDALLASSHKAVVLITKASGGAAGKIVNLSGRQRMLSQRMNSLYMLRAWGVEGFDFNTAFNKSVDDFKAAQSILEGSELTTAEIKKKIDKTKRSFTWFARSAVKQSDVYVPALVLRAADRILKNMNDATNLYANLKK